MIHFLIEGIDDATRESSYAGRDPGNAFNDRDDENNSSNNNKKRWRGGRVGRNFSRLRERKIIKSSSSSSSPPAPPPTSTLFSPRIPGSVTTRRV